MGKRAGPQVVGYVASQTERARITGALRGWALVLWAGSLGDLPELVRGADAPPAAAIVAPRDPAGRRGPLVVRRLAALAPDLPVIAHCHTGVEHAADVRLMAEAGVHEFLFVGVDDTGTGMRSVLASAQRACAAARVVEVVRPLLPERLGIIATACLTHPVQGRSVAGLATLLGVHRKTLLNQCARDGGPAPATLIGWCRLMLAAHLLATTGQTVEWVALELEYPSATALRNAMKRYTGLRASEVTRAGGLTRVVRAFERGLKPAG
jgi:AraC-like DNA-binding protein